MCGRYALKARPEDANYRFGLDECVSFTARYNIAPGSEIPAIRQSPEGKRVLHLLRWGLVPHWTKTLGAGAKLNNARGETVAEKPSYRDAFQRRRCLIPASGFYEWQISAQNKQPYYISPQNEAPFALGGLWESWRAPDGNILRTVCIVTTPANALMQPIHDRMPVIVPPDRWHDWLSGPTEQIMALLSPYRADDMQVWPVDPRVGRTTCDDPELILPVTNSSHK